MKKFFRIAFMAVLVATMLLGAVTTAFAADNATVNGKQAAVGSEVTYSFSVTAAKQDVVGLHLELYFDAAVLELSDVKTENFAGAIINKDKNKTGRVIFVASDINGVDCKEETEVLTATFKVVSAGTTDITYYVPYFYDFDNVPIYDYTFTSDLSVAGEVVIDGETPVLADGKVTAKLEKFDAGDFENNVQGTGSGEKPEITTAKSAGEIGQNIGGDDENGEDKGDSNLTVVLLCVGALVLAIVALVVFKALSNKKDDSDASDVSEVTDVTENEE